MIRGGGVLCSAIRDSRYLFPSLPWLGLDSLIRSTGRIELDFDDNIDDDTDVFIIVCVSVYVMY